MGVRLVNSKPNLAACILYACRKILADTGAKGWSYASAKEGVSVGRALAIDLFGEPNTNVIVAGTTNGAPDYPSGKQAPPRRLGPQRGSCRSVSSTFSVQIRSGYVVRPSLPHFPARRCAGWFLKYR